MYFIATFALIYSIDRMRGLSRTSVVLGYLGSNAALAAMLWWVPVLRRVVFGLIILAVLVVEALGRRRSGERESARMLWMAVGVLLVAFAIWVMDYERVICAPQSLLQGHAAWHVLGAVSAWCIYRYYQQSRIIPPACISANTVA